MTTLPKQNVTEEEIKKPTWYIPTIEYYINLAISSVNKQDTIKFLDAANGIIDSKEYAYVLKPFGDNTSDILGSGRLPGEVRDFNLITDIKEKNIGEYIQLIYDVFVKTNNPDAVLLRSSEMKHEVELAMQKKLMLILQGNKEEAANIDIENFVKEYLEDWERDRAIQGKNRLELLNDEINFDTLRVNNFYNWWAAEEFYTCREICNGNLYVYSIPPQEAYPIYNGEEFIEDCFGFLQKSTITYDEFFRLYRYKFADKDKDLIEKLYTEYSSGRNLSVPIQLFTTAFPDSIKTTAEGKPNVTIGDNNKILMCKLTWKYYKEVKFLLYTDYLGQLQEEIVKSDYVFDKEHGDISVVSNYIETVVTAYRFGTSNYIYTPAVEEPVQRRDERNPNFVKLPQGGRYGLHVNIKRNPIPNRVLPYEILLRVFTYALEQTIAKHKGNILVIPKSVLTDGEGGDPKAKIFMMKADNTFIVDDGKIDMNVLNAFKVIDDSGLEQYIMALITLCNKIRQDAYSVANMNQERLGNTSEYQPVRNANANMQQAKTGSALSIWAYHKALERDHNADIEWSKYAWINGKHGFFQDKVSNKFVEVNVDGQEHAETEYGIYVVDSIKEDKRSQEFKNLIFAAGQNGEMGLAAKGIVTDSSAELSKYIDEYQEAKDAFAKQSEQQKSEAIKYAADISAKVEKDKIDATRNNILIHEQAETARKQMEVESQLQGTLITKAIDGLPQPDMSTSLKERELDDKLTMSRESNQTKQKVSNDNVRIAKENKQ